MGSIGTRMNFYRNLVILTILFTQHAYAASFDCTKATSKIEKAICSETELSFLDDKLGKKYKDLKSKYPSFIQSNLTDSQNEWLKRRNKLCADGSFECLTYQYNSRIKRVESYADIDIKELKLDGDDSVIEINKLVAIFTNLDGSSYPEFIMYPKTKNSIITQLMNHPFLIGFSPFNTYEHPLSFEKENSVVKVVSCNDYIKVQKQGYELSIKEGPYRSIINYLQGCREAQFLIDENSGKKP